MSGKLLIVLGAFVLVTSVAEADFSNKGNRWDMAALNTAANVSYLSDNEKAVIMEINKLRADPPAYAKEYLEPLLTMYRGNKLLYPGDIPIVTKEGIVALRDAIQALKKASPVPLLSPDIRLTKASRDLQKDQSATGNTGHAGTDGSTAQARIKRYGEWNVSMGENIFYGDPDAHSVVLHLVIDDGIPGRGHRNNFLNSSYRLIGVAMGKHPGWRNVCVMDFANSFKK